MADPARSIAFQGVPGAYSDLACRTAYPAYGTLPCRSFEDAFAAVSDGRAALGMIPIENSVAGRVADIHQLLPKSDLHIVAEHFQRVNHHLLAPPGATLEGLRQVRSHVQALSQCRGLLHRLGLEPVVHYDTAGAASDVAAAGDPTVAAIASRLAGEIYGLTSLLSDIEDAAHNTTRFVVLARAPRRPAVADGGAMTTVLFTVRSLPAALYKALGGFATNGVNMTKLESYLLDGSFEAAQFYVDFEGHPDQPGVAYALEELAFFSQQLRIVGVYPAHPFRRRGAPEESD